jgi:hypothetical protein
VVKVKTIGIEIANLVFNVVRQAYTHTSSTKPILSIVFFANPSQNYNVLDESSPGSFSPR